MRIVTQGLTYILCLLKMALAKEVRVAPKLIPKVEAHFA
jgi:hypothetical protein